MLENKPLVSVIVITYNSSTFVLETLESVKNQTYQNIELIVSDDCSTDDTLQICKNWIKLNKDRFKRTELITTPKNSGIPANCNRGVRTSKGDWIKLIAGDDYLTSNCIDRYIQFHIENPEAQVMFSNVEFYRNTFDSKNKMKPFPTEKLKISYSNVTAQEQFQILLRVNRIWAGSLFISKNVFDNHGLYDESLRYWEDRPFLLKITRNNVKLFYVDFISCWYRKHDKSVQVLKKNEYLISPFQMEKSIYYFHNYLKYLPFFERISKWIILKRVIIIKNLNLNKKKRLFPFLFKVTAYPWNILNKRIDKKYF